MKINGKAIIFVAEEIKDPSEKIWDGNQSKIIVMVMRIAIMDSSLQSFTRSFSRSALLILVFINVNNLPQRYAIG